MPSSPHVTACAVPPHAVDVAVVCCVYAAASSSNFGASNDDIGPESGGNGTSWSWYTIMPSLPPHNATRPWPARAGVQSTNVMVYLEWPSESLPMQTHDSPTAAPCHHHRTSRHAPCHLTQLTSPLCAVCTPQPPAQMLVLPTTTLAPNLVATAPRGHGIQLCPRCRRTMQRGHGRPGLGCSRPTSWCTLSGRLRARPCKPTIC